MCSASEITMPGMVSAARDTCASCNATHESAIHKVLFNYYKL